MATLDTCFVVEDSIFEPRRTVISAISQADPAEVTTTTDHAYVTGTIVRLYIPHALGMQQLDKTVWQITVTSATTFTIPVNSTAFDPFVVPASPPSGVQFCPYVVPVGEDALQLNAATNNVLRD